MREKNRSKPKWARVLLVALAVLLALYAAAYLVLTVATGDPMPMPFGFGSAVVLTGSMEPTLSPNDMLFVVKSGRYAVGDIVVYSTGGTPVVHRIVSLDEAGGLAVTRGDANNVDDEPIPLTRIKGKMLFAVPLVGFIPRYVRTVPGMIMVLTFLFTLLYLSVRTKAQEAEQAEQTDRLQQEIARLKEKTGATPEQIAAADPAAALQQEVDALLAALVLTPPPPAADNEQPADNDEPPADESEPPAADQPADEPSAADNDGNPADAN